MEELTSTFIGYPCAQDFNYPEIVPFLGDAINNVGDPFGESIYRENTIAGSRNAVTPIVMWSARPRR